MNCKCGHSEMDHSETLFGARCFGKAWHDGAGYSCECVEFQSAETKTDPDGIPW